MKITLPALAGALICGAAALGGANVFAAPTPTLQPIAPGQKTGAPCVTKFAPLAYFNEKCARCHGQYGSFYGDDFGKGQSDAQLHQSVDEMASGPAQAPLSAHDVDVLTAWHRALRDGKPFVAVVSAAPDGDGFQLQGEISPGATLEINGENIEVKDAKWTARVGAGALKLRARKGEATTEVEASAAAFGP